MALSSSLQNTVFYTFLFLFGSRWWWTSCAAVHPSTLSSLHQLSWLSFPSLKDCRKAQRALTCWVLGFTDIWCARHVGALALWFSWSGPGRLCFRSRTCGTPLFRWYPGWLSEYRCLPSSDPSLCCDTPCSLVVERVY